jgi:hypothetical protein
MSKRLHDHRSVAMAGGMILLDQDELRRAPIEGLVRLAQFMGLRVHGSKAMPGAYRHALVQAIMREEKRLARAPKAKRHDTV